MSSVIVPSQAHQTHVSTLSGRGIGPYPASYAGTADGGVGTWFPVSCRLSATGVRLLGLPAPAGELGLPCGRLTRPELHCLDSIGVVTFRMREILPGRVPSAPRGTAVHSRPVRYLRSAPADLQRPVPISRWNNPSAGVLMTRHHQGFICIHPSGISQPVTPGWNGNPWALPQASHPAITRNAR